MKLMTKAIEQSLLKAKELSNKMDTGATEYTDGIDRPCAVKYFNPCGAGTWLILDGEKVGDDWLLYGLCHLYEWEWGYVSLKELESVKLPFGLGIERDRYGSGTIREMAKQLGYCE